MFTAQMSVTDDLITSDGIETSQGVRLKRPPLKSIQDGVDTIHPIGIMDMSGCGYVVWVVYSVRTGEEHNTGRNLMGSVETTPS